MNRLIQLIDTQFNPSMEPRKSERERGGESNSIQAPTLSMTGNISRFLVGWQGAFTLGAPSSSSSGPESPAKLLKMSNKR